MNLPEFLRPEERLAFRLQALYRAYGYSRFRMNKFEEYDFYVRSKAFLVSESIITFTDLNGKLMALKPDVTLSIVRSTQPGEARKVYYYENVYRPARGTRTYREIPQVGLERIGDVDAYAVSEVLLLAERSLAEIAPRHALNLSHLGILTELIRRAGFPEESQAAAFALVGDKNTDGLAGLAAADGIDPERVKPLLAVLGASGEPEETLDRLSALYPDTEWQTQTADFARVVRTLPQGSVRVDLSVTGDRNFYNGIVFHGYAEGVPDRVLSGGQYDKLMQTFGKKSGALGFAVYLDRLDRLDDPAENYRVDAVVLYDGDTDPAAVAEAMRGLTEQGKRAVAARSLPTDLEWGEVIRLGKGEER